MTQGIPNPPKTPHRPQGPQPAGSARPPKCELSPSLRSRIVQARADNLSWTQIREKFLAMGEDIPLSTLRSTVRRHNERVGDNSKPRSGRPRKIDADQRRRIEAEILGARSRTMRDLHLTVCPLVSSSTFKRVVRECYQRK